MPNVNARLRIIFNATPEFDELSDVNKKDFKKKVVKKIRDEIKQVDLNTKLDAQAITVDDDGHAAEAIVRAKVKAILDTLLAPDDTPAGITIDNIVGVRYGVWNNTRECIHEYSLNLKVGAKDPNWQVSHTYPDTGIVLVQMYGALAWNWAV